MRRPFSVISVLGQVHVLYQNPGTKKARWQSFCRACPAWQSRHELLRECFEPDFEKRDKKYNGTKCLQDFKYKQTVAEGAEYLESKDYLEDNQDRWRWHDLDPNATCIILTDGLKTDANPPVRNALLLSMQSTHHALPQGAHFGHLSLQAAHRMHYFGL